MRVSGFHNPQLAIRLGTLHVKNIDELYRQGKAHLEAKRYADALESLRQVRALNPGHYQDTNQLIVEAQTAMQKQKWQARPVASKKGCFLTGVFTLIAILLVLVSIT
ncbi:MAG: tetratricopeptide repeat protein [Chloroflexi bacterium]|nr:tetratricopeptide repeat protein [Chloroflexota bacterium]